MRRQIDLVWPKEPRAPRPWPPAQPAQDESREELAELWARLLANAMDPKLNSVRHSFIEAVKKMDPPDAVLLVAVAVENLSTIWSRKGTQGSNTSDISTMADKLHYRLTEAQLSLEHLSTLGLFASVRSSADGGQDYHITVTGREFMRACYPELGS